MDARLSAPPSWHVDRCQYVDDAPGPSYAYRLGLYLGDGCLSPCPRDVYRLRVTLDQRYPLIILECGIAMVNVLPNKVGTAQHPGCIEVYSNSKHWPCLFPQHAAGRKHLRPIVLEEWQERIALEGHPRLFLRGLIHSDGYRGMNPIMGGRYAYSRYQFSNRSDDIRALFAEVCRRVGIDARASNQWTLSVSRRDDVALLDSFIGPKR